MKCDNKRRLTYIAVYVDDLIILVSTIAAFTELRDLFMSCFNIKDLGEVFCILRVKITCTDGTYTLSQNSYLIGTLQHFSMADCKLLPTPFCGGDVVPLCSFKAHSKPKIADKAISGVVGPKEL